MNDRDQRLKEVAAIAAALEKQTGCPAQLMIAQWAIESEWGAKPVGHFNFFGIKRAARHTKWCKVSTKEVFTPEQRDNWNRQHVTDPARVITILSNGRLCVEVDDEFADYDSLDASCHDYAHLITEVEPYSHAWQQYEQTKNLTELIQAVARTYSTTSQYANLIEEIAIQANVLNAIDEA